MSPRGRGRTRATGSRVTGALAGRGPGAGTGAAGVPDARSIRADALARGGALPEPPPTRTIVLWCPDWPVIAAARAAGSPPDHPFALVAKGQVYASSASARQSGVVRGLRVREAQARCPELVLQPYDDALDHRAFEPVIRAVEAAVPGVEVLRPGTLALRSRGPARYYGGERAAAATLAGIAADHGAPGVRAGVADTPFAAEQAARARPARPGERVRIVPVDGSAPFLAGLPLGVLGDADLAMLLGRLGIQTLGEFAALADEQVRDRFGLAGAFLHRLAGGRDPREVAARAVPPELRVEASFEPPLDRADQIAFAFRRSADDFAARLRAAGLVATTIRVGIVDERDILLERTWVHPRWFDAADVVDRVRWQLAGGVDPTGLEAPVVQVVLEPVAVDDMANHERGLWGTGPDERVHHGLARVQGLVGHDGVVTPRIGGGRTLAERVVLVPWGDAPVGGERALATVRDRPWPGKLPGPPPATVLDRPRPVDVVTGDGGTVDVDDRGVLTGVPERFRAEGERGGRFDAVTAWAGPWPLVVRWWEAGGRRLHRLQLVDADGRAWYLVLADHRWWAEAVAT
ncbi:DNA polymerase Y family protein [Curtobacterium sp. AB451]|uniref:DNA polymerase Y family protein n=2 Tax=unclassified Curtobacterium TaxID=257496 RepID=UPI003D34F69D